MVVAGRPDVGSWPRHVAVIMDGNGRWAEALGLSREKGHEAGAEAVREVVRAACDWEVERLTLYAFSTENWKRPDREVDYLMKLLSRFLVERRREVLEANAHFETIGDLSRLPENAQREIARTIEATAGATGKTTVTLALNYGGREEIVRAARSLAAEVCAGRLAPEEIDGARFASHLWAPGAPEVDLLVRTAGEMRVSNFLLWQISYAEIHVTPVLWPDFRREHLAEAIRDYDRRVRRFGALPSGGRAAGEGGKGAA